MDGSPTTRCSLLLRIRDLGDQAAWAQFVEIYAPLVHGLACRRGLQEADAADLTQDVLVSVAGAADRFAYDPARGSFRSWLRTVARNRIRDWQARLAHRNRAVGGTDVQQFLDQVPGDIDERSEDAQWDREHRWRLVMWAAEQVRVDFQPETWQAFWKTAVEQRPAAEVAAELGMSVGAVYIAKSRVLVRVRRLTETFDE